MGASSHWAAVCRAIRADQLRANHSGVYVGRPLGLCHQVAGQRRNRLYTLGSSGSVGLFYGRFRGHFVGHLSDRRFSGFAGARLPFFPQRPDTWLVDASSPFAKRYRGYVPWGFDLMADKQTLDVYAEQAEAYVKRFNKAGEGTHMDAFLSDLPKASLILDLGCGPAHTSLAMIEKGYQVEAWDASPDFARLAKETYDVTVLVKQFDELLSCATYDAVFANFSLLHAPKAKMPDHLMAIARALKPNGKFHIGLKLGTGEKRDVLGRFYAYYQEDELKSLLDDAGFNVVYERQGEGAGLDGTIAPWIILQARKND